MRGLYICNGGFKQADLSQGIVIHLPRLLRTCLEKCKFLSPSRRDPCYRWLQWLRYLLYIYITAITLFLTGKAGKSTLARILLRIVDHDKGSLLVNGVDVRRYSPAEYHRHLSAVFQGFSKFSSTVKENVGLGNVEKIGYRPAIETAIHLAEADTLVESLPDGIKTMLETPGFEAVSYPGMEGFDSYPRRHGLSGGEVPF